MFTTAGSWTAYEELRDKLREELTFAELELSEARVEHDGSLIALTGDAWTRSSHSNDGLRRTQFAARRCRAFRAASG